MAQAPGLRSGDLDPAGDAEPQRLLRARPHGEPLRAARWPPAARGPRGLLLRPRALEANKTTVLLHGDEVSDRLLGVVAGYLVWSKRVPTVPDAIALVERLFQRSIGPDGRSVLFDLPEVGERA